MAVEEFNGELDGGVTEFNGELDTKPYFSTMAGNVLPSAKNYISNVANVVMHPIDTATGLAKSVVGAGEHLAERAVSKFNPELVEFNKKTGAPSENQQAASGISDYFVKRYGSLENAQNALRDDPVGVMGDVSMLLGGLSGGAKIINPEAYAAGAFNSLEKASNVTNPLYLGGKATGFAGRQVAKLPTAILGQTSGTGSAALNNAYGATKVGGTKAADYWQNLRNGAPIEDVVDTARQGLADMRAQMINNYKTAKNNPDPLMWAKVQAGHTPRTEMGWADDVTPLSFQGVDDAINRATTKFAQKNKVTGEVIHKPGVGEVADDVNKIVEKWKQNAQTDPFFSTVEGFDQLKQHLNDVFPKDLTNRAGKAYANEVVKQVKSSIIDQVPQYKKAMLQYWKESDKLDQISRELSLGDNASVGTALRKLQSVMRDSASTAQGYRGKLADMLSETGNDIRPALAGQALSAPIARGIAPFIKDIPLAIGAGALFGVPAAIGTMLGASPRALGELYGGLGTAARWGKQIPKPSAGGLNTVQAVSKK
jgi:hypothetical protein